MIHVHRLVWNWYTTRKRSLLRDRSLYSGLFSFIYFALDIRVSLFYDNAQYTVVTRKADGRNHALHMKRTLEVYMQFVYVILLYSRNITSNKGDQCFLVFATQQNGTSDIYAVVVSFVFPPSMTNISPFILGRNFITPYIYVSD